MEKIVRDNLNNVIGWTDTTDGKGTFNEFCDSAGYTYCGIIAETINAADIDIADYAREKGELH